MKCLNNLFRVPSTRLLKKLQIFCTISRPDCSKHAKPGTNYLKVRPTLDSSGEDGLTACETIEYFWNLYIKLEFDL